MAKRYSKPFNLDIYDISNHNDFWNWFRCRHIQRHMDRSTLQFLSDFFDVFEYLQKFSSRKCFFLRELSTPTRLQARTNEIICCHAYDLIDFIQEN